MQGFKKFNLRDLQERMEPERLAAILSSFSCPYNRDVEDFLHSKAVEFSKQRIASVYLIFTSYREEWVLVGYFALAQKYFHIDLSKHGSMSSNLRRRIRKFATYDEVLRKYIVTAPLIGQLGKNYANGYHQLIRGEELLAIACDTVREAQRILGGKVVYLECEDVPALRRFYEENGFADFGKRMLEGDERDKMKGQYLVQMLKYLGE